VLRYLEEEAVKTCEEPLLLNKQPVCQ